MKDEQYFVFMCCANEDENGNVDYINPITHEMANPGYGVTIRPDEILNDALQAQNDPQQRKDFYAKSLNVYTNALKAYFNIDEFRASDQKYNCWRNCQNCQLTGMEVQIYPNCTT